MAIRYNPFAPRTKPTYTLMTGSVGEDEDNDPKDVAQVENMLGRSGHLRKDRAERPTGRYDWEVKSSVEKFQADRGLKQDGLVTPLSPTFRRLAKQSDKPKPKSTPPKPPAVSATSPLAPTKPAVPKRSGLDT